MNFFLQKILLSCFFILVIIQSNAQANLSLTVSPTRINKDEVATISIIVENGANVQEIVPPSFKKLLVLSGPNQQTSVTRINGQVKEYVVMSFIVRPRETGKIDIEPALVNMGGKSFKTNPASLTVKNSVSGKGSNIAPGGFPFSDPFEPTSRASEFDDYIFHKGENIADKVNRNMQLKLETDKTSCFVGEPVVATYKLYTRLKSESKLTGNPSFNGFSVVDMTRSDISEYTTGKLNGREFNVYTIRKAQLYPLQAGTIDLEAAELQNNIQFIKEDYVNKRRSDVYDMFDNFEKAPGLAEGTISQTVSLRSKPLTITVKPLPEVNKPTSFNGAVGEFNMQAALVKTTFASGEAGKLVVRIGGKGNLQLLTAPAVKWPEGMDAFDPKVTESISKLTVPISGTKTFEYEFLVDSPGNYVLPAIEFSYFDPRDATYKKLVSRDLPLQVTKSLPSSEPLAIKTKKAVSGINNIFNHRWWIVILIAGIIFSCLAIWLKRKKPETIETIQPVEAAEETEALVQESADNQKNPLVRSEECLFMDDCSGFYSLLNTEIKSYLAHKLKIDTANLNTKNILTEMDRRNISNDIALQLQRLLQEIDWQLYTPFVRTERMKELYAEAQHIVQRINASI